MRKKVGVIKRVLCIVLIFLLSINSFASIISDNDGSAFITKSEFDALKSSFQAQIDSYNQSIDAKIDGAIASYLSGIKLSTQETIMPKNNQLNYKAMTSVNLVEGFCGLNVATANLVSRKRQQDKLANECGACAYIVLQVKSTPAYGFIANSDNSNNVFLIGTGTVTEDWTGMGTLNNHSFNQNSGDALAGRCTNWYAGWGNAAASGTYNTTTTYYGSRYDGVPGWRPILVGFQPNSSNYVGSMSLMSSQNTLRLRSYDIGSTLLYTINDEILNNVLDSKLLNGFTYFPITFADLKAATTVQSSAVIHLLGNGIQGWEPAQSSAIASFGFNVDPTYPTATLNNGDVFARAPGHPTYQWCNGTLKWMKVSHINDPKKIWIDKYDTTDFRRWINEKSVPADFQIIDNGVQYFNIRRGMMLFDLYDKKNCEVTCKVKNNTTSTSYIKIFTQLDSNIVDSFDGTIGMETDKSVAGNKHRMAIPASGELTFKFNYDSSGPVFFKCSNSADISILDIMRTFTD